MNSLQEAYDGGNEIEATNPVLITNVLASGVVPGQTELHPGQITLTGSGVGGGTLNLASLLAPLFGTTSLVVSDGKLILSALGQELLVSQGNNDASILMEGGQVTLRPFLGSGQLEYQFGANEAWATKSLNDPAGGPNGDGWWPIAHSGQVEEMINVAVLRSMKQHLKTKHPSGVSCY